MDNNKMAFFALLKAGLWEQEVQLAPFGTLNYSEITLIAEKQSVMGLIAAGIEHIVDVKFPQDVTLAFVGRAIQVEQQNIAINKFIARLINKLRDNDIYTLLVKGSSNAQCYERPLWRSVGDVDLLMNDNNYNKAKCTLQPLSASILPERHFSKELCLNIDGWIVELHGTQRTGLSSRVDKVIDDVQRDVFFGGNVRSWDNRETTIFLPAPDNDVFFIFTHFIKHFYKERMNLKQICDWCRLLWTYRNSLNRGLLESRIRRAGLMSEWKTFAALSVKYIGMPVEAMPLFDENSQKEELRWEKKAELLVRHILKDEPYSKFHYTWAIAKMFPWNTIKFLPSIFFNVNGLKLKERIFGTSGTEQ